MNKTWLNDTRTDFIDDPIKFLNPKYCTCMVITGGVVAVNTHCEIHGEQAKNANEEPL